MIDVYAQILHIIRQLSNVENEVHRRISIRRILIRRISIRRTIQVFKKLTKLKSPLYILKR